MSKRILWLLLVLIAVIAALVWWANRRTPPASSARAGETPLEIEFNGGFAFVVSAADNLLEIAFPNNPKLPHCDIEPLGTELMIVGGTLIEPATLPPGGLFDVTGAVVTFPDLESANLPLSANRPPGRPSPNRPADPNNTADWESLQWIASISQEHPATLNPSWRSLVNGRVVLRGGALKAMQPSDIIVNTGLFEFRNDAGPVFQQALTDKAHYGVTVPADRVEIRLEGAKSGLTQIVVQPASPGAPVTLKLMGKHADTPPSLPIGTPVEDFCVFYPLLQPIPKPEEWLKPVYIGPPVEAAPKETAPNPGPFCIPISFP